MKNILFAALFTIGIIPVQGQEKIQFSFTGGYEHFKVNHFNKLSGYGLGCEFKFHFYKRFYMVANFHMGINNEFMPRTAIQGIGEVDFSMHWRIREYKTGIGLGANLINFKKHKIYTQATFGLSKLKQSEPNVYSYRPTIEIGTKNEYYLKYSTSISSGYDYRISKLICIGMDYTGWWLVGLAYRNTLNAKISFFF
ncbi:hypothetical protein [Bacteroides ovatus]|uniref:hypothetical protein n=1 Tax=Bacteroides ovatus TaxID=28116 RepID=UPI00189E8E8A|nr:hypothetical protein [Bacteroides ovatus]